MATVQQVFDMAMALIDSYTGGVADSGDTAEYKCRAFPIINNLSVELYQFSTMRASAAGSRPVPVFVTNATDTVDLDSGLALGVLPSGLAALLLADENPGLANFHQQLYEQKLFKFRNAPQAFEAISDLYDVTCCPYNAD